ncbi:MAG: thioredoxin-disulfide reductase [Candidatus Eisenbacteria bacterium]
MERHDLVIIGGGPAGLTAGLYAGRSRLKTVVLESMMPGGQAAITHMLENYPGAGSVSGAELSQRMLDQMKEFGAELVSAEVTGLTVDGDGVSVAAGSETYAARSVIVASGTGYRKLGVPGEKELAGRGVSYCATCDGPFYKGQEIAVVGGGDSALQEALYLTTFASKIFLIHRRDEFRAVPVLDERVRAHEAIECLCSTVVTAIRGEDGVEALDLRDKKTGEERSLAVAGVFLFVGLEPRTAFLGDVVKLDEAGFVVTNEEMKTSVRGILAAGDCRAKLLRQVSTAVGDGATAAYAAQRYLEDGEW